MASIGVDMVSLDWTVTMEEGRKRLGKDMGVQGNLDPAILFAPHDVIKVRAATATLYPRYLTPSASAWGGGRTGTRQGDDAHRLELIRVGIVGGAI